MKMKMENQLLADVVKLAFSIYNPVWFKDLFLKLV